MSHAFCPAPPRRHHRLGTGSGSQFFIFNAVRHHRSVRTPSSAPGHPAGLSHSPSVRLCQGRVPVEIFGAPCGHPRMGMVWVALAGSRDQYYPRFARSGRRFIWLAFAPANAGRDGWPTNLKKPRLSFMWCWRSSQITCYRFPTGWGWRQGFAGGLAAETCWDYRVPAAGRGPVRDG